jgi:hypothetical protein
MLYQLSYTPTTERKNTSFSLVSCASNDGFYTLPDLLQTAFCKKMRRAEARRTYWSMTDLPSGGS